MFYVRRTCCRSSGLPVCYNRRRKPVMDLLSLEFELFAQISHLFYLKYSRLEGRHRGWQLCASSPGVRFLHLVKRSCCYIYLTVT